MKKYLILIIYITLSNQLFGQSSLSLDGMISHCLPTYINTMYAMSDNKSKNSVFICKDGFPSDYPYDSISDATYISVDLLPYYSKNVKKAFQKGQRTLFVSYELKGNQLIITITDRFVKLIHKKRINIGLSDWGRYYFEYSCEHEIWELIETQYGGV